MSRPPGCAKLLTSPASTGSLPIENTIGTWFVAVFVLGAIAFVTGRRQSLALVGGAIRELHSLPGYYGWYNLAWCLLPAVGVLFLWLIVQPIVIDSMVEEREKASAPLPPGRRV